MNFRGILGGLYMIVKRMNEDVIRSILDNEGVDGLIKHVHEYTGSCYWRAYRDGYIKGQGIGYQDGKYDGYAKAINEIVKAK